MSRTHVTLPLLLAVWSAGCTYDFDQYRVPASTDMQDMAQEMTEPDLADVQEDVDVVVPPMEVPPGTMCSADDQCGEDGVCRGSLCTKLCDASEELACPETFACVAVGPESMCLPTCGLDDACAVEGRSDLTCVPLHRQDPYTTAVRPVRLCLQDADTDNVWDLRDNCAGQANPTQRDRDGDGMGDACDPEPWCHPSAEGGIVTYASTSYAATSFSIPSILTGGWVPVLGGLREEGTQAVNTRLFLDRRAGTWSTPTPLPYPGHDFSISPTLDGGYLTTPGRIPKDAEQRGRTLGLREDGSVEQVTPFVEGAYDVVMGSTGNGEQVLFGYLEDAATGGLSYRIWRYRPTTGTFSTLYSGVADSRVPWYISQGGNGDVFVYSDAQQNPGGTTYMVLLSISENLSAINAPNNIALPEPDMAQGAVSPFYMQTASGLGVILDRKRGLAYTVLEEVGQVARASALDLALTLGDAQFASLPKAAAVLVVGRDPQDPSKIAAIEYALPCLDSVSGLDMDMDSVDDLRDNCHENANAAQMDLDRDDVGNVCDADLDGDGRENDLDQREDAATGAPIPAAEDADNDGQPDAMDGDRDNDGIPDAQDRLPLDTDNDGLPNARDSDDDADGYSDSLERRDRTDPLNPLSFANSGTLVFIRETGAGERSLHMGELTELGGLEDVSTARILSLPAGVTPHEPRMTPNGDAVAVLAAPAGMGTRMAWTTTDINVMRQGGADLGVVLRGVAPTRMRIEGDPVVAQLEQLVMVQERTEEPGRWSLVRVDFLDAMGQPAESRDEIVESYPDLRSPYVYGSNTYFSGAPGMCEECLTAYRVSTNGGMPRSQAPGLLGVRALNFNGNGVGMLAPGEDGEIKGYYNTEERMPPGAVQANSAVALSQYGHMIVSAARPGGTFDIWFFNGRTRVWYKLMSSPDELIEVDWKR